MFKRWQSIWSLVLGSCMAVLIAGCSDSGETTADGQEKGKDPVRVAYVLNGALGDQSFYDSGQAGINRLVADYGIETITIENNFDAAKYPQSLESAVKWRADVIYVISYGYEELVRQYADRYPDITFVNIDTVVENSQGTITSINFSEEEGSFMAGVAAALMTSDSSIKGINEEKKVGTVSGMNDMVVNAFLHGFRQGVAYIDDTIEYKNIYVGSWSDPVKGKQATKQLYSQGVDVVFQVAALTGTGVLEAAAESGRYAIGVDSNQNGIKPGHIPTSMLKNVGNAIYDTFAAMENSTFEKGAVIHSGLAQDGVGLAIDEHSRAILPASMLEQLDEIKAKVVAGEITVEPYKGA